MCLGVVGSRAADGSAAGGAFRQSRPASECRVVPDRRSAWCLSGVLALPLSSNRDVTASELPCSTQLISSRVAVLSAFTLSPRGPPCAFEHAWSCSRSPVSGHKGCFRPTCRRPSAWYVFWIARGLPCAVDSHGLFASVVQRSRPRPATPTAVVGHRSASFAPRDA